VKRIIALAMLICAVLVSALSAQERSTRAVTNGVTATLIENGTALSFTNSNNTLFNTDITLIIYYADGSNEWKEFSVVTEAGKQTWNNIVGGAGAAYFGYQDGPTTEKLGKRAAAISVPTAAQITQLRNQREEAERVAVEKARREAAEAAAAEAARKEAPSFVSSGEAAAARGDGDRAIADFTRAIQLDPNLASAYAGRGTEYYKKSDWDRAIADFTQAIRLDPKHSTTFANRGAAYNSKNDWDRAISDCTESIRLDPNYANAYRHRAFAYIQKGSYAQARADVNMALKLNPNYQNAKNLDAELKKKGY
jgi:tetratricopeptide (TPR) repeat protein